MIIPNFDELYAAGRKPRVHGNGFLQLDLNDEGTKRLHVWDNELPRQKVATPIHDHVFALRSEVIVGTLIHEELFARPLDSDGTHRVYRAQQEPGTQNTILVPDPAQVILELEQRLILGVGSIYTFPSLHLHQTNHRGTTATIMEKIGAPKEYGRPRVLVPVGQEPDNEFKRDSFDEDFLWGFVEKALVMA